MGTLLHHGLAATAARRPDAVAVRTRRGAWTFAELDERSTALRASLTERGVRHRDRVAVQLGNRAELVVVLHALSRVGAAAVLLSPSWKQREVEHALALTAPVLGIADGTTGPILQAGLRTEVLDLDRTDVRGLPAADPPIDADVDVPDELDECLLVFSSGTTGLPKAVRHTHRSIAHATRHWVAALGLGDADAFQIATPSSHILGALNLLAAVSAGASVRLHERFHLETVLEHVALDRTTLEMAVAPIAMAMADHPRLEDYDLSSLRYVMWGATPVTESVALRFTERTGVRFLAAYGASELPVLAVNPVGSDSDWRLDTPGLPPSGVELRVVDVDSGAVLPPGGVGEIQARSASLMAGYLPEADTADAVQEGWYRTGDVGWLEPQGWVHVSDRLREMIKVNGFQVAPAEVEAVLHAHPAVVDCAVFGVPDARSGEVPVAAVQRDPAQDVSAEELQDLVLQALAGYKQVRHVLFVSTIPRLPSGKVLRRELREAWSGPAAPGA